MLVLCSLFWISDDPSSAFSFLLDLQISKCYYDNQTNELQLKCNNNLRFIFCTDRPHLRHILVINIGTHRIHRVPDIRIRNPKQKYCGSGFIYQYQLIDIYQHDCENNNNILNSGSGSVVCGSTRQQIIVQYIGSTIAVNE